jgi:hypothetical protein
MDDMVCAAKFDRIHRAKIDPGSGFYRLDFNAQTERIALLAVLMETEVASCLFPRAYFLQWLGDQIEYMHSAGLIDLAVSSQILEAEYLAWIGSNCSQS